MATHDHIRNPVEWGWDQLKQAGHALGSAARSMEGTWEARDNALLVGLAIVLPILGHATWHLYLKVVMR